MPGPGPKLGKISLSSPQMSMELEHKLLHLPKSTAALLDGSTEVRQGL